MKIAWLLLAATVSQASVAFIRGDGDMTCYSLDSGKREWIGSGDSIGRPSHLRLVDSILVAPAFRGRVGKTVARNIRTGAAVPAEGRLLDTSIDHGHLPLLGERKLTRAIDLLFGNKALNYLGPRGDTVVILKYYSSHMALQARNSMVFLPSGRGHSGIVHAYHAFKRRLAWTFAPLDHFPDISDAAYSDLALDGRSLLVATDQKIFLMDSRTGRLLHRIPGGEINPPDPVAAGNLVCIATRAGQGPVLLGSMTSPAVVHDSVLSVARIAFQGPAGDSVRIDRIRRKQVPPGAPILLSFVDPRGDKGDYVLQQKGMDDTETRRFKLPPKVNGERVLYVVLNDWFKGLYLSRGEKSLGYLKYEP